MTPIDETEKKIPRSKMTIQDRKLYAVNELLSMYGDELAPIFKDLLLRVRDWQMSHNVYRDLGLRDEDLTDTWHISLLIKFFDQLEGIDHPEAQGFNKQFKNE